MRSRYSAFFHKNIDYLIATRDPDHRQANDRQVLAHTCTTTRWLGLVVMKTDESQLARGVGYVEFAAFYEQKGTGRLQDHIHDRLQDQIHGQIHEMARFVKKEGRWVYCDGQMLSPVAWGRNQSCWCGSHKKFKKCHGAQ
jgi:SEC-C motif domain protein